jgi:hypothetical protein
VITARKYRKNSCRIDYQGTAGNSGFGLIVHVRNSFS